MAAADRPPNKQARAWAVATVLAACRSGRIDIDDAEQRLDRIYSAVTFSAVYEAISGLPHPPAPLLLTDSDR